MLNTPIWTDFSCFDDAPSMQCLECDDGVMIDCPESLLPAFECDSCGVILELEI